MFSSVSRILFESTVRGIVSDLLSARAERQRYQVGRRFHRAIRRHLSGLERYPMHQVWSEFALSTNLRGMELARTLQRYTEIRGKRYLDIGCAYGGYPIAFAAEGAEAVGIDINGRFLEFAASNIKDQKTPVLLLERDVTKYDQICDLGGFDIITCNDLIEHVEDVARTVEHIGSLLRPGGLLYMQIPNGFSAGQVLKDGHYGLFGITLLSRPDAIRYFGESGYNDDYGVGYFHRLDEYIDLLATHRIRLHRGEIANSLERLKERITQIRAALDPIRSRLSQCLDVSGLSLTTKRALADAVTGYLVQVSSDFEAYDATTDEGLKCRRARSLVKRYEIEFWEMIGVKSS